MSDRLDEIKERLRRGATLRTDCQYLLGRLEAAEAVIAKYSSPLNALSLIPAGALAEWQKAKEAG